MKKSTASTKKCGVINIGSASATEEPSAKLGEIIIQAYTQAGRTEAAQRSKTRLNEQGRYSQYEILRGCRSDSIRLYLGIDGGSSGAVAAVDDLGGWQVNLVSKIQRRGHWLLTVDENLWVLQTMAINAGGLDNVLVAYEQCRKNPNFGCKNNFVNGRNEEFWRVLLAGQHIPHCSVDPKTWQSMCFKGLDHADTKDRAREYIRRRCPETTWLDSYNKAPREAIVDAMCIALWCKDQHQALVPTHVESVAA